MHFFQLSLALLLGALPAASAPLTAAASSPPATLELTAPCPADSGKSNLFTAPDGSVYLTWSQAGKQTGERALLFSRLTPGADTWSDPKSIISTPALMENWADFASLTVNASGVITAQWFQDRPGDERGYSGWMSRSADDGLTWSAPVTLGQEFVSLAALPDGRVLSVWLEHIASSSHDHHARGAPAMKLCSRLFAADGSASGDWVVDPDVCTCCQTTLAVQSDGSVLVAYRGHTADEIRDHLVARFTGGAWSKPVTLHDDHWQIAACPVNGPAADVRGAHTAIAWFTAANGVARVQAKFSADGGLTFGPALPVDLGHPLGRVDLAMLADGSALVTWLEVGQGNNAAGLYARRIYSDGTASSAVLVQETSQSRTSGFPRIAFAPDRPNRVVLTWTVEQAGHTQVRTAWVNVPGDRSPVTAARGSQLARDGSPLELCGETPVTPQSSVASLHHEE